MSSAAMPPACKVPSQIPLHNDVGPLRLAMRRLRPQFARRWIASRAPSALLDTAKLLLSRARSQGLRKVVCLPTTGLAGAAAATGFWGTPQPHPGDEKARFKTLDCWRGESRIASWQFRAGARMRQSAVWAVAALCACLSGCVTTEITPLAPNFVRLDVRAPFPREAAGQIMRLAAEATLQHGYTYFRLTPMYWTAGDVGVTVVMFNTGEPGTIDAYDARAVIASRGW